MELVDDPCGSAVPNLESALQQRRRATLILDADLRRLAEQLISVRVVAVAAVVATTGLERFLRPHACDDVVLGGLRFGQRHPLLCGGGLSRFLLARVPVHQAFGVLIGQECALNARRLALAGRNEEHVAIAQQRLGAHAVENRA